MPLARRVGSWVHGTTRTALCRARECKLGYALGKAEQVYLSALDNLHETAATLAETKMTKGHAAMDAESAMAELERLAARTGRCAVSD